MKKIVYLIVALLINQSLFAQTKTWNGSVSTDWFTAANWTDSNGAVAGVPTATDNVVINISTNAPIIQAGTPAFANSITISSVTGTLLTVNSGATLTVSRSAGNAVSVANGTLVNNGTINITNTNPTEVSNEAALRVFSSAIINNFGTMVLNGGVNMGLYVSGANFVNKNGATLMSNGLNVIRLATPNSFFTNETNASISGTGTSSSFFLNPGSFSNSGSVDVSGQVEIYGTPSNNSSFTNNSCSIIKINGAYFNQPNSTTTNAGLMRISGNLNNNGTYTNNGSLVANAYPTYTNRRLQINNNAANNALFTISTSAGSTNINGIYLDEAGTLSAGTYVSNTFTPNMGSGIYTLYVNVTQSTCNYTIPFSYTRSRSRWYVKTTSSGAGDGTSWADASGDLQAIINGSIANDSVWIASGVYKPQADASGNTNPANARQKVFYMKSGMKIFGGFGGTETNFDQRDVKTNKTIFSGDIDNNDTNTDGNNIAETSADIQGNNVYQLLVIANCNKNTLVDGIILTAAKSNTTSTPSQTINGSNVTSDLGSALHIVGSYPIIRNCVFSGNYGGFFGNFYQNNNTITYVDTVKVISAIFTGNFAEYGGGMFIRRGHHYSNNLVMYNNTSTYGGALIVQNNMAASGTIDFINSTFVNNYSTFGKSLRIDAGTTKLINSIVYNAVPYSGGNISGSGGGTLTSSFSILQNSLTSAVWNNNYGTDGGNNLDVNPTFLNIADIDGADNKFFTTDDGLSLSLCPTPSPGINAGTNANVLATDITSSPRTFANTTDIGAYELQQYIVGSNLNLTTNISGTSIQASSNTILATNTILSGANVQYLANNSITLNPQSGAGFTVNNGAVFEARITPLTGCN